MLTADEIMEVEQLTELINSILYKRKAGVVLGALMNVTGNVIKQASTGGERAAREYEATVLRLVDRWEHPQN